VLAIVAFAAGAGLGNEAAAGAICQGFGPQAPRDITSKAGTNSRGFSLAPPASQMNLCNIHIHSNAEHKAPGFSVFAGEGVHGGYRCNETASLTAAELENPTHGHGTCHDLKPGDTIEVHWATAPATSRRAKVSAPVFRSNAPTRSSGSRRRRSWWSTTRTR
jgi:hypothetical protein